MTLIQWMMRIQKIPGVDDISTYVTGNTGVCGNTTGVDGSSTGNTGMGGETTGIGGLTATTNTIETEDILHDDITTATEQTPNT